MDALYPDAMPNCLYGKSTVANALVEHYVHGTTTGGVTRRTGIGRGAFLGIAHRTAEMFRPAFMNMLYELCFRPAEHPAARRKKMTHYGNNE